MSPPGAKERPRLAVPAANQGKESEPERRWDGGNALAVYPKEQAPEHVRIRYRRGPGAFRVEVFEW